MKQALRSVAAFFLCALFLTFTLWRQNALPDMTSVTTFVQQAAERINQLSGDTGGELTNSNEAPPRDQQGNYADYSISEPLDAALEAHIVEGFNNRTANIDIASFGLTVEEAHAAVSQICLSHPEFFYIGSSFSFSNVTVGSQKMATGIKPTYLYNAAQTAAHRAQYNAMVQAIADSVPDGSDFDKLLYLHDYFVANFTYDYNYQIRDAYNFFLEKEGVCQAYMLALIATANACGIESVPVTSTPMKHAWNLVKLDGKWYHVDLTWDDSVSLPSMTSYRYFLQSDTGLAAIDADLSEPHREWQTNYEASDTSYDNVTWRKSYTPMRKMDGRYYCTVTEAEENGSGVRGSIWGGDSPTDMTRLHSIKATWYAQDGYIHTACYAGLGTYQGKLIYNTNNSLRIYDPVADTDRMVGLINVGLDKNIYGITGVSATGEVSFVVDYRELTGNAQYGTYSVAAAA